ncbi:sla2 Src-like adaptor 2 [Kappamyces sp. JEL0680]|nr:sla2 Src-like adaptor 2 [Kappamyces sp. JEL0680]
MVTVVDSYGYGNSNSYGNSSGNFGASSFGQGGTPTQEQDLAISLKKALTVDELAPKQKHVRAVILYTWDCKGSGNFWQALKTYPMMGDDIIQYKSLILFHKDALNQVNWLDGLVKTNMDYGTGTSYSGMIKSYVQFLKQKLDYHRLRPFFSGTFDYEEFVSLKGVQDPNEGYETISELIALLDKLDKFVRVIFGNIKSYGANECRVAALVPLVEESHGIYKCEQVKTHHNSLVKFYGECTQIRYLTSLISIPTLGSCPDFLDQGPPKQAPRNTSSAPAKPKVDLEEEAWIKEQERLFALQDEEEERKKRERQAQYEQEQSRQEELRRMQEAQDRERQLMLQRQQEQMQMQGAAQQLEYLRQQSLRDRELLMQYDQQLSAEIQRLNAAAQNSAGSTAKIGQLTEEINQWKQKYEALAKLYAQLRKEHLDLLQKFKTMKDGAGKITEDARKKLEAVEAELKTKNAELTEVMVERNRLKGETDLVRLQYEQELQRLRHEVEQSKLALADMSNTRGSEVQSLVARFTAEQEKLEQLLAERQSEIGRLTLALGDAISQSDRQKRMHEEETLVLQAGLDQALGILKQHQDEAESGLGARDERIGVLEEKHRLLLSQMMGTSGSCLPADNVFDTCITTVQDSIYVLEGSEDSKASVSPQFVLVLIEKATQKCSDFGSSFVKLVNGGDPKDAVTASAGLAQSVAQLLRNGTTVGEMERLMPVDSDDDIVEIFKKAGLATLNFFASVKSQSLNQIPAAARSEHVLNLSRQSQYQIGEATEIVEKLVSSTSKLEGDLSTAVEREMAHAAKAIEEAAAKLQGLLARGGDLHVHGAILHAAVALTTAISHLIKCATDSQNEIVAQNKGAQTTTAFYKKNNKWTEGLISAAHSVASSTVFLVGTADGLVQSTHSWEQLVVAAQDVGVATTQLVAAARVKAAAYSKTQDKLEQAAVAVREATKLVVKAAKDASKLSAESQARQEIGSMSKHEAKVKEMEQQVKILELEKALSTARFTLGEMRKQNYHEEV